MSGVNGSIAQLGEHLPYKQRVIGSSPIVPTTFGLVVQLVRTLACHARGRGFEPHPGRHTFASVAQSVEQGTENPCVAGSIPAGATIFVCSRDVFNPQYKLNLGYALVAQLDRVFGYEPKGQGFESLRAHHISGSGSTW